MSMSQTTTRRQAVALPAPDPIPLGGNRYRVPSASQPHVSYIVDLDAGEAGTCGCPHFIHRQTPCKHIRAALRAARAAASGASGDVPALAATTPPAPAEGPQRGYFDERGIYVGALAEAFDRPMGRR